MEAPVEHVHPSRLNGDLLVVSGSCPFSVERILDVIRQRARGFAHRAYSDHHVPASSATDAYTQSQGSCFVVFESTLKG